MKLMVRFSEVTGRPIAQKIAARRSIDCIGASIKAEVAHNIERLNTDCACVTLDIAALRQAGSAVVNDPALFGELAETRPHLLAAQPVFLSPAHAEQMQTIIRSIEAVAGLPSYQSAVLENATEIAHLRLGPYAFLASRTAITPRQNDTPCNEITRGPLTIATNHQPVSLTAGQSIFSRGDPGREVFREGGIWMPSLSFRSTSVPEYLNHVNQHGSDPRSRCDAPSILREDRLV